MQNLLVFIYLLTLTSFQIISSFEIINTGQNEKNLDDIRRSSSLLSSDFLSFEQKESDPECLPKNLFSNMLDRNQRASISRPYFQHWRRARDNNRYTTKNSLAFSPRLGKRTYEDDQRLVVLMNKQQLENEHELNDLNTFLIGYLLRKNIDIIYEDQTTICLSQSISNDLVQEILEKYQMHRSQPDKKDERRQYLSDKNPFWFHYRLG
ncbi:unnamed protein product [Rotaria sordida]|uniref:Uncharacterized protein n=1 Tax=Rotaria sordida TaxID=392033 RepID=A0A818XGH9_9BILA|nr:unnamed protein product [Rotaria sordida]